MFNIDFGVRQGSVLSQYLFAVYMDDLAKLCQYKRGVHIVLYADDILLLAPSVNELQHLLTMCEAELNSIDMKINVSKSCCLRIGPRHGRRHGGSRVGKRPPWKKSGWAWPTLEILAVVWKIYGNSLSVMCQWWAIYVQNNFDATIDLEKYISDSRHLVVTLSLNLAY